MTTEEKATKYDEALEWMRKVYSTLTGADKEDVEHYFPELKESEDERVRKAILSFIKQSAGTQELTTKEYSKWIEYLEKQKKQKPVEDWREKRKEECPFRRNLDNNLYGCERYADVNSACTGACSWVVDYPKLKEIQDKKELDAEIEKELRTHYNDDQDVYWWNYLKNSFRHFYELGRKGGRE